MTAVTLRRPTPEDAPALGRICFEAFSAIAGEHNFPADFPSAEAAARTLGLLAGHPRIFGVAAEFDGRLVGSNFLDERNPISGVGPITVDPAMQNGAIGRALMGAVLDRSAARGFPGVRLVQAAYHRRSLALYAKLGFEIREPLACFQGAQDGPPIPGVHTRAATPDDAAACNALCARIHGHDRAGELADAIAQGSARVVERAGRVTGYATAVAFFGHAVGETGEDVAALIATAERIGGAGVLVPLRNGELVRWSMARGLHVTQTLTLMSMGLYSEPKGAWLPSVTY